MRGKKQTARRKNILPWLLVVSVILNFIFGYRLTQTSNDGYKVLSVLDGDTLVLDNKVRLRLRNIDAPELVNCGGKEAKRELEKLLGKNKQIRIEERILDQRGRAMAYVYSDRTWLNLAILEKGWARYHHDNSPLKKELKQAADQAKLEKLGLYGQCVHDQPPKKNCVIKGNIDNNSPYTKRYYYPGCAQYQFVMVEEDMGEAWFCTETEAQQAGYSKARSCY